MTRQSTVKATEMHRRFGQLLKQIYGSDEHLIIEREGYPVAVMMSYQEYEQLSQTQIIVPAQENLPPTMSLEEAFGSVTPINQPEDFNKLRKIAIEEKAQKTIEDMNKN